MAETAGITLNDVFDGLEFVSFTKANLGPRWRQVIQRTIELIEKRVQLIEDKVVNLELNLRVPPSPLKLENMSEDANAVAPNGA
ncbi:hypothetical protein Pmar_PMAR024818 [Perkinsus marinus ATCC 50983]|uniref:Uncharacterized protein n=1 Tax=Perkinsus marinus (strain ATCC 50983 / TXsc) TaxID=423536 RepID=C5M192_PERM5|nr:hypothetical protein Pmar_PMAR024818 [Perkinsus marinus ATCC 50983]EEQ97322.1 hypothetical protein Pmar_PMAR024818 [Perkinsus marinus ATCC 50983]|eukprot:XP_002764605.1 hypothetical protein Pmar_PMAR024818 [Perkinsus marinus ATCC 50983]